MPDLSLTDIARECYGGTATEVATFAKEKGHLPDERGLIEFPEPVDHTREESGFLIPVMGIISVEDATPATDQELEEAEQAERAKEELAEIGLLSTRNRYRWRSPGGQLRHFTIGNHRVPPSVQGYVGSPTASVSVEGHLGGRAHQARTFYSSHWNGQMGGGFSTWSPIRRSQRLWASYSFTATVYAMRAEVWWA